MNVDRNNKEKMEVGFRSTGGKGGFLRNLVTNIKGPAASVVLVVWIVAVVFLSVYGKTPFAPSGMGLLSTFIVIYLVILGNRPN
jgi:type IV secretory pathway VirB2 component (pilin)